MNAALRAKLNVERKFSLQIIRLEAGVKLLSD